MLPFSLTRELVAAMVGKGVGECLETTFGCVGSESLFGHALLISETDVVSSLVIYSIQARLEKEFEGVTLV